MADSTGPDQDPIRVMVVDDGEEVRTLLQALLEGAGYRVEAYPNGAEALGALRTRAVDLVISDVLMPALDGFALCREVKSDPALRAIPFVFYTASYVEQEDRCLAMDLGAARFLVKPMERAEFLRTVAEVVASPQSGGQGDAAEHGRPEAVDRAYQRALARKLSEKVGELEHERAVLRESEAKYRTLFESANDAILVLEGERLVDCNARALELFGGARSTLLGTPILRLSAPVQADGQAAAPLAQGLLTRALRGEAVRFEWRHRRLDGTEFEAEVNLNRTLLADRPLLQALVRDISERRRAEDKLRQAATVFENTAEGVIITDPDGGITAVNPAFTEITGYAEARALGETPRLLKSGRHDPRFYADLWASLLQTGHWRGEIWNRRQNGEIYPQWTTISAVKDDDGVLQHYVAVFSDLTEIKRSQEQIDYLAHHDALTDLPNRLLFRARLEHAMLQARREGRLVAVLSLDLDRFKHINDSLGHPVGDQLLRGVARRLQSLAREQDTVARLGGDEFAILVEDLADVQGAAAVAQQLLQGFAAPFDVTDHELFLSASVGISLYPSDGLDVHALISNADAAMYRAKDQGRNVYQFYTAEFTTSAFERVLMETQLRRALARGEFTLHYQPQIALADGALAGAEALLRWRHPEMGLVTPAKFVPIAEETGLIDAVGEWVLQTACAQARGWQRQGVALPRVAVNVSAQQFRRDGFVELVRRALAQSGLSAACLELEVTEGLILQQTERAIGVLEGLRALGVLVAIDDFGTGYSSLSYLKRLPIDKLKIDRSFVRDIPHDANDEAIAKAVIALGHSLQMQVIAEGVDNAAQEAFLKAQGCDQAQGYLHGRPMAAEEFLRWLRGAEGRAETEPVARR